MNADERGLDLYLVSACVRGYDVLDANLFWVAVDDVIATIVCIGVQHAATTGVAVISSSLRLLPRKRRQSSNVKGKVQSRARSDRCAMAKRRQR